MKNVRYSEKKKCIFKLTDEFERDVMEAFGEIINFTYAWDGFSCYYDGRDEEEVDNEVLCGKLSDYYDVIVTSIHMDECEDIGVWIVYKETPQQKLISIDEELDSVQEEEPFQSNKELMNELGECIGHLNNALDMMEADNGSSN